MPFGWGFSFWFEAAPKTMRRAVGAKALMDGVIVAVAHGEVRGMGLRGFVEVYGWGAGHYAKFKNDEL